MATVELAFVLPLLLLILAGVIDFGRMGFDRCILASAAEHAAAVASHDPPTAHESAPQWLANIRAAAEADLSQLAGFSPTLLEVAASRTEQAGVECVRVEIRYPFQTWFAWPGIDHTLLFAETAVRPVGL